MARDSTRVRCSFPLFVAAAIVGGMVWSAPLAGAVPGAGHPADCVPFGTAQLPPGLPSAGGAIGLEGIPEFTGDNAPVGVELRTPTTQFNRFWEFSLVGTDLLTRPRGSDESWRYVPMPECLRGSLVGISLDDDELLAVDDRGWIYTMDNASQDPLFWNWTSAWGAMLWTAPGRQLPGSTADAPPAGVRDNTWALSITSPWDNKSYTDIAGRIHPSGQAKMTMVPTLTGDGSRITYADPWLPNDDSYEIGGPLGGRFQSTSLSAAGSTTFVMNEYGDMYTRTFDFDSSGSDSVFFRYSWFDQSGKPSATDLTTELLDRSTAAVQLPAPGWDHQPKIPGEITSVISVYSTGPGPERRELRVEGTRDGETGFWHKDLAASAWEFTPTGAAPLGAPVQNPPADRSSDTLAPPVPWNLSAPLPSRDAAVDAETLVDIGLPYSVVDPRILDDLGLHAGPSGYGIEVAHFDPAATSRDATVTTPEGDRIPVVLNTADGMRMTPRGPGLDSEPRHLIGAIEISDDAYEARGADPALDAFVRDWMRGKRIAPITLSATDHDLVVR